jgi:SP family sugar:H+ symporter-like MFS transporter
MLILTSWQVFGYVDPATPVGYNIAPGVQQLITSLMTLGAFIGSLAAGKLILCECPSLNFVYANANKITGPIALVLSRKQALWTACLLCAVSDAIMMDTTHLAGLYVGRLFIGFANGFFMTFSQLYLQVPHPVLTH